MTATFIDIIYNSPQNLANRYNLINHKLVVLKHRKNHTSGFKTKEVLEALQERETIQEIGKLTHQSLGYQRPANICSSCLTFLFRSAGWKRKQT